MDFFECLEMRQIMRNYFGNRKFIWFIIMNWCTTLSMVNFRSMLYARDLGMGGGAVVNIDLNDL